MLPREWRKNLSVWSITTWARDKYSGKRHRICDRWLLQPWDRHGRVYIGIAVGKWEVKYALYDVLRDEWDDTTVVLLPALDMSASTRQIAVVPERESFFVNVPGRREWPDYSGVFEGVAGQIFQTIESDIAGEDNIAWTEGELHMFSDGERVFKHQVWDKYSVNTLDTSQFGEYVAMNVVRVGLSGESLVGVSVGDGELYKFERREWRKLTVGALPGPTHAGTYQYCHASSPCGRFVILINPWAESIWVLDLEANNMWASATRLPVGFAVACMTISRGLRCMSWLEVWVDQECAIAGAKATESEPGCVDLHKSLPSAILHLVANYLGGSDIKIANELHVIERDGGHAAIEMVHVLTCECSE